MKEIGFIRLVNNGMREREGEEVCEKDKGEMPTDWKRRLFNL